MSFNRYLWWRHGMDDIVKPLKGKKYSLLEKIRHGDYDFSFAFTKALIQVDKDVEEIERNVTERYKGVSQITLQETIREETRMKNVKRLKLQEELWEKEHAKLHELRLQLRDQFNIDLWDEIADGNIEVGETVEDLYKYYKTKAATLI